MFVIPDMQALIWYTAQGSWLRETEVYKMDRHGPGDGALGFGSVIKIRTRYYRIRLERNGTDGPNKFQIELFLEFIDVGNIGGAQSSWRSIGFILYLALLKR